MSHSFPRKMLSKLFNKERANPSARARDTSSQPVTRTNRDSHRVKLTRWALGRHRLTHLQQTTDGRQRKDKVKNSNLDLLLVK